MQPLKGLVIVEIGDQVAARYCGLLLASLGARVIRVTEPPDRLPAESKFLPGALTPEGSLRRLHLDVGKQSIVLNYARPEGQAVLAGIVARADVVVEGLGGSRAQEAGLDETALRTSAPEIIIASLSWFGQTGPYREYHATDLTCSALSGYVSLNGYPDQAPLNLPTPLGQYLAGLSAAIGVCALAAAGTDYSGSRHLDVSVQESLSLQLAGAATDAVRTGAVARRAGNRMVARNGGRTYNGVLPCADGYVVVGVVGEPDYHRLAALGLDVASLPEGARTRPASEPEALDRLIAPWLLDRRRSEVSARAQEVGLHWSEILDPGEAATSEQAQARGTVAHVTHPIFGPLPVIQAPLRQSDSTEATIALLGAQTEAILVQDLGLTPAEIRALVSNGAV